MLVKGFATSKLGILCIDHSWYQTSLHLGRNDVIWKLFETQQKHTSKLNKNRVEKSRSHPTRSHS